MKKLSFLFIVVMCAILGMQAQNVTLPYVQDFSSLTSGGMVSATSSPTPVTVMPSGIQSVINAYEADGVIRIGDSNAVGSITTLPIDVGGAAKIRIRFKYAPLPGTNSGTNENGALLIVFNGDSLYTILYKLNKTWPLVESDLKTMLFELEIPQNYTPSTLELGSFAHPEYPETRFFMDSLSIEYVCIKPTEVAVANITESSATISFTEPNNSVTTWQYVITDNITVSDPNVLLPANDITSNTNAVINDLLPNTTYKVWVRSLCTNGTYSDWSAPVTFKTICSETSVINETFDSYTQLISDNLFGSYIPDCWSKISNHIVYPKMDKASPYYGNTSTVLTFGGSKPIYFVSQRIDMQLDGMLLSFKLNRQDEDCGVFQVGYMSDPTDASTFTAVASFNDHVNRQMIHKNVLFTNVPDNNGANRYIAFRYGDVDNVSQSTYSSYWIDDIELSPAPQCTPVVQLKVESVTATSVTLSFESHSPATSWQYIVSQTLTTNPDAHTPEAITSQNFTINDLTPNTTYGVWVRANCGGNEYSTWSFNIVQTGCGEVARGWEENFSNYDPVSELPYCWIRPLGYASANITYPNVTNTAGYSDRGLRFYMYGTRTPITMMATPIFRENLNQLQAAFWLKSTSDNNPARFEVGVMSNVADTSTFVPIQHIAPTNTDWNYYEVPLTAAPNTHRHIALRMSNPTGESAGYFFDELLVDTIPTCKRPMNISVQGITSSSSILSFNSASDITAWQYVITADPYVQQPEVLTPVDINENPTNIENLSSNTTYRVWVRGNCGNGYSKWSMLPAMFRTACGNVSANYADAFEQGNPNDANRPYCWTVVKDYTISSTSYPIVRTNIGYINNGAMELRIGGATNNKSIIASPKFVATDTLNKMAVSFWLKRSNIADPSMFEVGVMSDITDENTFLALHDVTPTTSDWTMYDVTLSTAPVANRYIAFRITQLGTSASPQYFLDDLYAYKTSSCIRPTSLTALPANITASSAELSWSPVGTETNWVVEYKTSASSQWTSVVANTNTYQLSGLQANTEYMVRVKAHCSPTDESIWSYPIKFKTTCQAEVLPFTEDFSTSSSSSFPPTECWGRYSTKASDVFNGSPMTNGGYWRFSENQYGINSKKAYFNIYGSYTGWLVTPTITLQSNSVLEFDASYKKYNSNDTIQTNGTDDIFMVVVSTDAGLTWSADNATIWNNSGESDALSLNGIPGTPYRYSISLGQYSGDIKIGFYAESSISNADNNLYIDNISINQEIIEPPTVVTMPATDITETSATLNKEITEGTHMVTETGFWYWVVGNNRTAQSISGIITNLTADTQYQFYAYAIADGITYYGDTLTFRTLGEPVVHPIVTTLPATNVTTNTATLNKTVVADESEPVVTEGWKYTKRGEESTWMTSTDGILTGLDANTEYRFFAFATTAINSDGYTGDTLSFTTSQTSVGLEQNEYRTDIYPNPANSLITIKVDGMPSAEIIILDMMGKIVGKYTIAQGNNSITVDVSTLVEGNYIVRIITDVAVSTERLIIKK